MPVFCTFLLNNRETSTLQCSGFGPVEAYSGRDRGRDNPGDIADVGVGPIPPGTYYLVDRQSGGHLGRLWDSLSPLFGSTDRTKWFALWAPYTGDMTFVHGVRRGEFRLHPEGDSHLSKGCITVKDPHAFDNLQRYIRLFKPDMSVPGSNIKAYGRVEVR